jgi:hypothetical protein
VTTSPARVKRRSAEPPAVMRVTRQRLEGDI